LPTGNRDLPLGQMCANLLRVVLPVSQSVAVSD
jgi:hypothetical protein